MKGPAANAGLKPNRFKMSDVIVPIKEANTTTLKSASDTTIDKRYSPKSKIFAPNTSAARTRPFRIATEKTFVRRVQRPSSTKSEFARL